jgi:hypothetical protein
MGESDVSLYCDEGELNENRGDGFVSGVVRVIPTNMDAQIFEAGIAVSGLEVRSFDGSTEQLKQLLRDKCSEVMTRMYDKMVDSLVWEDGRTHDR